MAEFKHEIIPDEYGTELVVPLAEIKASLGIIHDLRNDELEGFSEAGEQFFERETRRILIDRTVEAYFTAFNSVIIQHRPNVRVQSVEYYDTDSQRQTLSDSVYAVDSKGLDTVLSFNQTVSLGDVPNPIIVTYLVGYGEASDVPSLVKTAIKGLVSFWYWNPSPVVTGTIAAELPLHVQSIINQFKVVEV